MTDEIESDDSNDVYVLKLVSGETIIADVSVDIDILFEVNRVQLFLPAVIVLDTNPEDGQVYHFIREWIPFTSSHTHEIRTKHIMLADYASDKLLESYAEYVMDMQEKMMLDVDEEQIEDEETDVKKLLH